MLRGLYSVAGAMDVAAANQEIVAENLAHASTPGYRRQGLLIEAFLPPAAGGPGTGDAPPVAGVRTAGEYSQFDPGPIQQTGNPLDLALTGNAYFVLEGPNGPLYTRGGVFEISTGGELQTKGGLRVRGQGGPINLPATAGTITVTQDGAVLVDGIETGRLQLATFENPRALRRASGTTFEGPAPQTPAPGTVRVEQGYREGSNVQPVQEMVSMMLGVRQYEAAEKTMRAMAEALAQNTRPQNG